MCVKNRIVSENLIAFIATFMNLFCVTGVSVEYDWLNTDMQMDLHLFVFFCSIYANQYHMCMCSCTNVSVLSICLVCISICLSLRCLSVYVFLCLYACTGSQRITESDYDDGIGVVAAGGWGAWRQ